MRRRKTPAARWELQAWILTSATHQNTADYVCPKATRKTLEARITGRFNCIKVPEKQIKKFLNTHSDSIVAWILFVESSY